VTGAVAICFALGRGKIYAVRGKRVGMSADGHHGNRPLLLITCTRVETKTNKVVLPSTFRRRFWNRTGLAGISFPWCKL